MREADVGFQSADTIKLSFSSCSRRARSALEKPQAFVKACFTKGEAIKDERKDHILCSSANRAARRRDDHDR
jgi:hypothetical protein